MSAVLTMFKIWTILVLTAPSVSAFQIESVLVNVEDFLTVTWTTSPPDPASFSIQLNHPSFSNGLAIGSVVDASSLSGSFSLPVVPPRSGYFIQFVDVININTVLTTSQTFSLGNNATSSATHPATSLNSASETSPSSASPSSAVSSSATHPATSLHSVSETSPSSASPTSSASSTPTSPASLTSSASPTSFAPLSSTPPAKKKNLAGPIAGGVVGGLFVVLSTLGVFLWLARRRRQRKVDATFPDAEKTSPVNLSSSPNNSTQALLFATLPSGETQLSPNQTVARGILAAEEKARRAARIQNEIRELTEQAEGQGLAQSTPGHPDRMNELLEEMRLLRNQMGAIQQQQMDMQAVIGQGPPEYTAGPA